MTCNTVAPQAAWRERASSQRFHAETEARQAPPRARSRACAERKTAEELGRAARPAAPRCSDVVGGSRGEAAAQSTAHAHALRLARLRHSCDAAEGMACCA
eukprot:6205007-Pleurochrysis_carterae.AAC.4